MKTTKKQKVYNLLKGIETGDPEAVTVVNENKYIQHNPQTYEGGEGLAHLFTRLSKTNPKVEIVQLFQDGDYVFGHTIYDFSSVSIGFEVFRYEGEYIVEHWDNIQARTENMIEGSTELRDIEHTEENRNLIKQLIDELFINKNFNNINNFINLDSLINHNSLMGLPEKIKAMDYQKNHRILAEGNFVLSVSEGVNNNAHTSFYDLFRIENKKIIEHWDTTEKVLPKSLWKNDNGKF